MTDVVRFEEDLQASPPEIALALSKAGVSGVQKAVRIRRGDSETVMAAIIDCTVDLAADQKGVHMSRFPELFGEAIDELVIPGRLLVEQLAEHIATHIVERQRASRAEVRVRARYPIERLTPVTGLATQELVTLIGVAAATTAGSRRLVGVEATGINACPCAQGLVREQEGSGSANVAAQKLRDVYLKQLEETRAKIAALRELETELADSLAFLTACDSACESAAPVHSCPTCERHPERPHAPELVTAVHLT